MNKTIIIKTDGQLIDNLHNGVAARKGDQPETAGGIKIHDKHIAEMADRS